jgi:hypothetical protein
MVPAGGVVVGRQTSSLHAATAARANRNNTVARYNFITPDVRRRSRDDRPYLILTVVQRTGPEQRMVTQRAGLIETGLHGGRDGPGAQSTAYIVRRYGGDPSHRYRR